MSALAGERTVVLTIPNMTRADCQIAVARTLKALDGVSRVTAAYITKRAYVTFDDRVADLDALKKATAEAGYPVTESAETTIR
jgi:mercuric ion binding protein